MKKTKKAVSLILAFAMVLSAMLGCMTVSSFATEGQATEGPKLVDYSIDIANDTKTEAGAEFKINLKFDQQIKIVEKWILSAFNITLNGGSSLDSMGFELKSGEVSSDDEKTVILDVKAKEDVKMPRLVSGELDVSLKSNYYDAITDATGELPVSEWTDINTYVPTGLGFEKVTSVDGTAQKNSVTFKMTGPAMLRGMSSIQILVDGESITKDPSGLVPIHTHTYLANGEFVPVSTWVKALCEKFQSDDYTITQGTEDDADQFTIAAKANESNINLADSTEVHMFGYAEPNDEVVQTALFSEELSAAKERADEIKESNAVAQECKDALTAAITEAEGVNPNTVKTGLEWQTIRADLQSAVDGAQDNAITTTSVTRSNGSVSLSLLGGQDWIDQVESVKLNDKVLEKDTDYSFDSGMLKIKSLVFDTPGQTTAKTTDYTVTIESKGYATVTQEVTVSFYGSASFTIRLLAKDGSVKERTFTKDKIESMAKSEANGGEGIIYSTACSMTGSRAFKGDGAYLSALIEAAGLTEGEDFNPNTTMVKFRTNDSNDKTDKNDDPTVDSYFGMISTPYSALMADRYYFQDLYNSNSDLYKVYAESASINKNDDNAVAEHNLKLREAMAKSDKVKVQSMIAYQFVEDPNVDLDDKPLTDVEYDENLAADKCFRFLLGTAMVTEDGKELSSTENTTMRATYQVYGIDLVEEPAVLTFDTTPADADITLTDIAGNEIEPNEDGTYSVTAGKSSYKYTYTVSAPGYVEKTGTVAVTKDQTVEVSLSRESSGGGGGGSAVAKDYTVTFDSNGGSDVAKQTVTSGEKVNKPADPTREGYEFAGWYTDSKLTTAYDFSSKVTKSITLYAKWTEKGAEPEPSTSFKDVAADAWYAEYVSYLAGKGIVNGKTADTFAPDAQITRAEFIKIIAGVAGADVSGKSSSRFSDVASDAWYAPYVAWGVENGIINGTSETTFHPNGNISRQDMATMIKRYTDFAKFTLPTDTAAVNFTDSAQISSYAADAVKAMQQAGIINGKGGNTFAPKDNATRAEACKMLTVLMKMMEA